MAKKTSKAKPKSVVGDHDVEGLIDLPPSLSPAFFRKAAQVLMDPTDDWKLGAHVGLTAAAFALAQLDDHEKASANPKGKGSGYAELTEEELAEKAKEYADELEAAEDEAGGTPAKGFKVQPWMIQIALTLLRLLQDRLQEQEKSL